MVDDKHKVEIAFVTTADPAGAAEEIRIIDTVKEKAVANNEEFAAWQSKLKAERAGSTSGLATEVVLESDLAEKEAARGAARLSNEAAMAEAQEIRFTQAKEAAAAQAAADLEQVLAAREKLALDEARTARFLQDKALHVGLLESGIPDARIARTVLMNQTAMEKLGNLASGLAGPWGIAAAAVGAGALAFHEASKSADEMIEAGEKLGMNMEDLQRAAHPLKAAFTDLSTGSGSLLHSTLDLLTLGTLSYTQATTAAGVASMKLAQTQKENLEAAKAWNLELEKTAYARAHNAELNGEKLLGLELAANLKLLKERNTLEAARVGRAGMSAGDQAAAGLSGKDAENQGAEAIAAQELKNARMRSLEAPAGIAGDNARHAEAAAQMKLDALVKENDLKLTGDAEAAQQKLTEEAAKSDAEIARQGIALIEGAKQKQGGVLSAVAANAENLLQPIWQNATGTKEEWQKTVAALQLFTQTSDAQNAGISQNIWALISLINTQRTETAKQWAAIAALQAQALDRARTTDR